MALTVGIIARGIEEGLERAVKFMMPGLLIILIILLFYSITQGDFRAGIDFLLKPDFTKITSQSILAAMGQAFFTLSLGMGCIVMYGAYLPKRRIHYGDKCNHNILRHNDRIIGWHGYLPYCISIWS